MHVSCRHTVTCLAPPLRPPPPTLLNHLTPSPCKPGAGVGIAGIIGFARTGDSTSFTQTIAANG